MAGDSVSIPEELGEKLAGSRSAVVMTGAGISAESGIPTFRDAQTGLWARYRPEELATPQAFLRDPKLVWDWYAWRRELIANAKPNAGHLALAALEERIGSFLLVTQNVDNLHRQAGSSRMVELHGNITRTRCFDENRVVDKWNPQEQTPPRCPHCNGMLRPDVVWFGESLPMGALEQAMTASQTSQFFFSIGTSSQVQPAASLAFEAKRNGATVVEINPVATPLTPHADFVIQAGAASALPALLRSAWSEEA